MNNYALSEDQILIQDTVRKFVLESVEPTALDRDEHAQFTRSTFEGLAELGLLALPVAEEHGGAGMGMVAFVSVLEEIAGTCGSTARLLLDHAGLCGLGLAGLPAAEELLGGVLMGEALASFVGRDAGLTAAVTGDNVVVDGSSPLVVGAAEASVFVVAARTAEGEELIVQLGREAVECGTEPAMAFRAAGCVGVQLRSVTVPSASILARGADATAALDRAERAAWLGGAAMAIGIARKTLAQARSHALERIAFGKPLMAQQSVAGKFVECQRANDAARHQVYHAARLWDAGEIDASACAMARLSAVRAAVHSADEAIQIHGGYGYTVEYHVERHYRDAQALEVMDRGSRILRNHLAAALA